MRAKDILAPILSASLACIHAARVEALWFAVDALLTGERLSLTCLGRGAKSPVCEKHSIKRIDRLLGNVHLHREQPLVYAALAQLFLWRRTRLFVLIDWTQLDDARYALCAAVPLHGRSLPLCMEVHSRHKLSNPAVEKRFLRTLKSMLPQGARPTIITDAGFRNPWFETLRKMGWDYVGRLTARVSIRTPGATSWRAAPTFYAEAAAQVRDLGVCEVGANRTSLHRVVLGRQFVRNPARSAQRRRRTDRGRGHAATVRRAQEPWLIATSLMDVCAQYVISLYEKRMQIEETFRDAKSHRFGWSLQEARAGTNRRWEVLLLIAAIAFVLVMVIGKEGERLGLQRRFQANTVSNRRVLSLFTLGRRLIASHCIPRLSRKAWRMALLLYCSGTDGDLRESEEIIRGDP